MLNGYVLADALIISNKSFSPHFLVLIYNAYQITLNLSQEIFLCKEYLEFCFSRIYIKYWNIIPMSTGN